MDCRVKPGNGAWRGAIQFNRNVLLAPAITNERRGGHLRPFRPRGQGGAEELRRFAGTVVVSNDTQFEH